MRSLAYFFLALGVMACGSSSSSDSSGGGDAGGGGSCPDVSGAWKVTKHCDASLVGQTLTVSQKSCTLSFAPPFDGFEGSVTNDGKISLTGPQTCSGTATSSAVAMTCTPGTCDVALAR